MTVRGNGQESVRAAGVLVDEGGRPVTDAGGRLVFRGADGSEVLDDAGTAPLEPVEATGTGQPPAADAPYADSAQGDHLAPAEGA